VELPQPHPLLSPLRDLLSGKDESMPLDLAALALATIEFPDASIDESLSQLDQYASALSHRIDRRANGREFVLAANQFLFEEVGLRGNADDYHNPRNSCLNQVLSEHSGIPISLSVVYMEVARRLDRPVWGIGLPGHFVVQYNDGLYSAFIDPFHHGAVLTDQDCYNLAQADRPEPALLAPVTNRQILRRMINNLRGIYFSRRSYAKAVQLLNLMIESAPESADEYKQRGLVYMQTRQFRDAVFDLRRYLALAPDAADREQTGEQIRRMTRWLASLN
jgi:regulator of sirC expression with transglutaminase-like and TPR domain